MSPAELRARELGEQYSQAGRAYDDAYYKAIIEVKDKAGDNEILLKALAIQAMPEDIRDHFYDLRAKVEGIRAQLEHTATESHQAVLTREQSYSNLFKTGEDAPTPNKAD